MNITKEITVSGMQCSGCETIIEEAVNQIEGVQQVKADYPNAKVIVSFDTNKTRIEAIYNSIAAKGYSIEPSPPTSKNTFS